MSRVPQAVTGKRRTDLDGRAYELRGEG